MATTAFEIASDIITDMVTGTSEFSTVDDLPKGDSEKATFFLLNVNHVDGTYYTYKVTVERINRD